MARTPRVAAQPRRTHPRVERVVVAVAVAVGLAALAACTPRIETIGLDNRSASGLDAYWNGLRVGGAGPADRGSLALQSPDRCTTSAYRVMTADRSRVAVLEPDVCAGEVVVIDDGDLLPATATVTAMNASGHDYALRDADGQVVVVLADGKSAQVPIGMPAGGCIGAATVLPEWEHSDETVCDGDRATLGAWPDQTWRWSTPAALGRSEIVVVNDASTGLDVYADGAPLGSMPAHLMGSMGLSGDGCATVRVLSFDRRRWAEPGTACPGGTVTVGDEDLRPTAVATIENAALEPVQVRLSGPSYAFELSVAPRTPQPVPLWKDQGCIEITSVETSLGAEADTLIMSQWGTQLCPGDLWWIPPGTPGAVGHP